MTHPETQITEAAAYREDAKIRVQRRRLSPPSPQRDLLIFKMVLIEHFSHGEVARRMGLTRGRVTQIVQEVSRRLAQAAPDDPDIKNYQARQRLDQVLEKMRLEYVLETTAKALRSGPQPLTATRSGDRNKAGRPAEHWHECITREQTLNVQVVKAFLRATDGLRKLSERALAPAPEQKLTHEELFRSLQAVLEDWLLRVHHGENPPDDEFIRRVGQFNGMVLSWLRERENGALPAANEPQSLPASAIEAQPTSNAGELSSLTTPLAKTNQPATPPHPDAQSAILQPVSTSSDASPSENGTCTSA